VAVVAVLGTVAAPAAAGGYVDVRAPASATVGEPVPVTVVVTVPDVPGRNGSSDGTVELAVDGERAHGRTVTATDGETVRVEFVHTFDSSGEYVLTGRAEATIEGTTYSDSDRTTVDVEPAGDDGEDPGDGGETGRENASAGEPDGDADPDDRTADPGQGDGSESVPGGRMRSSAPSVDPAGLPGVGPAAVVPTHPVAVDATGDGRVTVADALDLLARGRESASD